jgi:hypothetical protein
MSAPLVALIWFLFGNVLFGYYDMRYQSVFFTEFKQNEKVIVWHFGLHLGVKYEAKVMTKHTMLHV